MRPRSLSSRVPGSPPIWDIVCNCFLLHVSGGPTQLIPEVAKAQASGEKLLHVVESWLQGELEARRAAASLKEALQGPAGHDATIMPTRTPLMPSKHLAFFR